MPILEYQIPSVAPEQTVVRHITPPAIDLSQIQGNWIRSQYAKLFIVFLFIVLWVRIVACPSLPFTTLFPSLFGEMKGETPWGVGAGGVATAEVCNRYEGDEELDFVDLLSISGTTLEFRVLVEWLFR